MYYEPRRIAKVFKIHFDTCIAFDDFVYDNPAEVASVNTGHHIVEMRNGDVIYFITMGSERDLQRVAGNQFNSIECRDEVSYEVKQYLRSRLRSPVGEVDSDLIIITGD